MKSSKPRNDLATWLPTTASSGLPYCPGSDQHTLIGHRPPAESVPSADQGPALVPGPEGRFRAECKNKAISACDTAKIPCDNFSSSTFGPGEARADRTTARGIHAKLKHRQTVSRKNRHVQPVRQAVSVTQRTAPRKGRAFGYSCWPSGLLLPGRGRYVSQCGTCPEYWERARSAMGNDLAGRGVLREDCASEKFAIVAVAPYRLRRTGTHVRLRGVRHALIVAAVSYRSILGALNDPSVR